MLHRYIKYRIATAVGYEKGGNVISREPLVIFFFFFNSTMPELHRELHWDYLRISSAFCLWCLLCGLLSLLASHALINTWSVTSGNIFNIQRAARGCLQGLDPPPLYIISICICSYRYKEKPVQHARRNWIHEAKICKYNFCFFPSGCRHRKARGGIFTNFF